LTFVCNGHPLPSGGVTKSALRIVFSGNFNLSCFFIGGRSAATGGESGQGNRSHHEQPAKGRTLIHAHKSDPNLRKPNDEIFGLDRQTAE
jgi:hypothetical protein